MSIVGTRPPTLDEWNKYELHHRARLSLKDQKKLMENLVCFSDMGLVQRILLLIDTYQDANSFAGSWRKAF